MRVSATAVLSLLCSVAGAKDADELFTVILRSKDVPKVPPVPARYMETHHRCPLIRLADSGVPEAEVNVGSPPQAVRLTLDIAGRQCTLPVVLVDMASRSLSITSTGNWRDTFRLGRMAVDQEFRYTEENADARLGLNVDSTDIPLFNNIVSQRLLGMDIFSFILTRQGDHMVGELLLGDAEESPTKAILRHNPVPMDELGWSLRIFDLRLDGQYYGYVARAVIDTTTPFNIFPREVFKTLAKQLGRTVVQDGDILMALPDSCDKLKALPPMYFSIETDEFVWDAAHYAIPTGDGQCVLAMAGYDAKVNGDGVWILGTSFFVDRVAVFDYATQHIGLTDYQPDPDVDGQIEAQLFRAPDGFITEEEMAARGEDISGAKTDL